MTFEPSDLISEIDSALGSGITSNYSTSNAANDLFEGFVLSLIVRAALNRGASVQYENVHELPTSQLIFRTSPGNIFSTHQDYGHAVISFEGCPELEAHIGVFVSGRSGVIHECDVAVIYRSEGQICRESAVHPRASKLLVGVECKFHAGTLQLALARGYLGLLEELSKKRRFLVSNAASDSAAKMMVHHDAKWFCGLASPSCADTAAFQSALEVLFRDYIAAHS